MNVTAWHSNCLATDVQRGLPDTLRLTCAHNSLSKHGCVWKQMYTNYTHKLIVKLMLTVLFKQLLSRTKLAPNAYYYTLPDKGLDFFKMGQITSSYGQSNCW